MEDNKLAALAIPVFPGSHTVVTLPCAYNIDGECATKIKVTLGEVFAIALFLEDGKEKGLTSILANGCRWVYREFDPEIPPTIPYCSAHSNLNDAGKAMLKEMNALQAALDIPIRTRKPGV